MDVSLKASRACYSAQQSPNVAHALPSEVASASGDVGAHMWWEAQQGFLWMLPFNEQGFYLTFVSYSVPV